VIIGFPSRVLKIDSLFFLNQSSWKLAHLVLSKLVCKSGKISPVITKASTVGVMFHKGTRLECKSEA
jgi:hypothetical protein